VKTKKEEYNSFSFNTQVAFLMRRELQKIQTKYLNYEKKGKLFESKV